MCGKGSAGRGQGDLPARTGEQIQPETLLEHAQLLAQGRLGDVQAGCRPTEVQLIGQRHEILQQPRINVHKHRLCIPIERDLDVSNLLLLSSGRTLDLAFGAVIGRSRRLRSGRA